MTFAIEATDAPDPDDLALLGKELAAFNDAAVGPSQKSTLAVFMRDPSGTIAGGLSGYTAWGWLYVQWLWLSESARGRGLAGKLLERAESEARARGCHGALIDTFSPDALRAYQRAGYVAFGTLEDFPKGRRRTFLQKNLGG